jgi:hypothetical protein
VADVHSGIFVPKNVPEIRLCAGHVGARRLHSILAARVDFYLFKSWGRNISGGVQATPLSEFQQGLGIW